MRVFRIKVVNMLFHGGIIHLDTRVKDTDCIWVTSLTLMEKDVVDFRLKHVRLISVTEMKNGIF